MKKTLFVLLILFVFAGCSEKGGFADQAKIVKAQSSLIKIRNALEEYRIDKGAYPGTNSDWLKRIAPYFTKENPVEPELITNNKLLLLEAENTVTQVSGVIGELRRKALFADSTLASNIFKIMSPIDSILNKMRHEVGKGIPENYPDLSIYLNKLDTLLENINAEEKMNEYLTSMERDKDYLLKRLDEVEGILDSLGVMDETMKGYMKSLKDVIEKLYVLATGEDKSLSLEKIPNSDNLIDGIVSKLDKKKNKEEIQNIEKFRDEVINYKRYLLNIEFLDYAKTFEKKIPVTVQLVKKYRDKLRENSIQANIIMNAYDALDKCRVFINMYKSEHGQIPTGNLRKLFENPEKEDEFDLVINKLASDPILQLTDDGYEIRANAKDEEKTEVVFRVRFINKLDELLKESFSGDPVYMTVDSTRTFFVKARAQDSFGTLVTTRPEFVHVKKEEKK